MDAEVKRDDPTQTTGKPDRSAEHIHAFKVYGDHGPEDYGDELAEWCPGCGRSRADIETPDIDPQPLTSDEVASLRTFVGPSHADSPGGPIAWVPWPTWERLLATLDAAREQAATEARDEYAEATDAAMNYGQGYAAGLAATEAIDKYADVHGTVQRAFALIRDLRAQGLPKDAGEADRLIIVAIAGAATEARRDLDVDVLAEAIFRVGIGHREGMPRLRWAVEHQQEWAVWVGNANHIAAEYRRLIEAETLAPAPLDVAPCGNCGDPGHTTKFHKYTETPA